MEAGLLQHTFCLLITKELYRNVESSDPVARSCDEGFVSARPAYGWIPRPDPPLGPHFREKGSPGQISRHISPEANGFLLASSLPVRPSRNVPDV